MCLSTNSNWLTKFDLLGNPLSYHFNGKNKFYIPFGGFLTVILVLIFISLISVFVIPFYQRLDPRVVYQNIKVEDPSIWNLYFNKFILGFKIDIDNFTMKDFSEILEYEFTYKEQTSTGNALNETLLETTFSTADDFNQNENFYESHMKESIKLVFDEQMALEGASISERYSFIEIKLNLKNDVQNSTTINKLINAKKKKIRVFYSDFSLELDNYSIPGDNFTSFFEDDIEIENKKKVIMEFSINNITTDFGFVIEKTIETKLGIMHASTTIISSTRKDLTLFDFTIRMSKYAPIYYRSYMKLPELLASIGGILSIVQMNFQIINGYVGKFSLNVEVMDKLLEFDRDFMNRNNSKKNSNIEPVIFQKNNCSNLPFEVSPINEVQSIVKTRIEHNSRIINGRLPITLKPLKSTTNLRKMRTEDIENKSFNSNNMEYKITKKIQTSRLTKELSVLKMQKNISQSSKFFHSRDIRTFLFCFCCKNSYETKKFKIYQKALEMIKYYTDYLWVVRKSMEVDTLKYLILNSEQNNLYKLMKRPYVSLTYPKFQNENHFNENFKEFSESFLLSKFDIVQMNPNEKNKCLNIYRKIERKENKTAIDQKILNSIGDNNLLLN